jgi:3-methyladenine DNA glycosylase AlkD
MNSHAFSVTQNLQALQNQKKARWLENYVKHGVKSYGVGIPIIREIVNTGENSRNISKLNMAGQKTFLNDLLKDTYTESKLAAILYIQIFWKSDKEAEILQLISGWFDNGWITDWNVCDWLCVRILAPLLDSKPQTAVKSFSVWNQSPDLWKARASLVPFTQLKNIPVHKKTITIFSETLIRRDERFCKTAVGWVLREYSKVDKAFVLDFLEKHKQWTTNEVIKNATKYIFQFK